MSAPGASWWGDDLARERQAIIGSPDVAPDGVGRAADQLRLTTSAFHGRIPQALRTSRRLDRRLEVHGPADWRELLTRFPRRVTTTDDLRAWGVSTSEAVVPDWPAFAEDWDGVHVSMLGLLTAQGVPVEVDGLDWVLEDVDLAMTAWFRPAGVSPDSARPWRRTASPATCRCREPGATPVRSDRLLAR